MPSPFIADDRRLTPSCLSCSDSFQTGAIQESDGYVPITPLCNLSIHSASSHHAWTDLLVEEQEKAVGAYLLAAAALLVVVIFHVAMNHFGMKKDS